MADSILFYVHVLWTALFGENQTEPKRAPAWIINFYNSEFPYLDVLYGGVRPNLYEYMDHKIKFLIFTYPEST